MHVLLLGTNCHLCHNVTVPNGFIDELHRSWEGECVRCNGLCSPNVMTLINASVYGSAAFRAE